MMPNQPLGATAEDQTCAEEENKAKLKTHICSIISNDKDLLCKEGKLQSAQLF